MVLQGEKEEGWAAPSKLTSSTMLGVHTAQYSLPGAGLTCLFHITVKAAELHC